MIQRITSLTARIVDFSRYLRSEGYDISPDRESMALLAVENTVFNKTDFRHSLKSIFPTNRNTYLNFDGHFDQYFKETNIGVDSKIKEQKRETVKKQKQSSETRFNSLKNWLTGNKKEEEELAAYGGNTRLETKDFSAYSDEDLKKAEHIIRVFLKKIRKKSGRRKVWVNRSNTIDLQATMKKNFRKGIEINDLIFNRKNPSHCLL